MEKCNCPKIKSKTKKCGYNHDGNCHFKKKELK